MPFQKLLLMTKQGIGSPTGPCRLPLLKGNCHTSKPKQREDGSFLAFFSCLALVAVFSLWRVEPADETESISCGFVFSFCAGSVKLALVLSSVAHLGTSSVALSSHSNC